MRILDGKLIYCLYRFAASKSGTYIRNLYPDYPDKRYDLCTGLIKR
jgi:hypothetical protein